MNRWLQGAAAAGAAVLYAVFAHRVTLDPDPGLLRQGLVFAPLLAVAVLCLLAMGRLRVYVLAALALALLIWQWVDATAVPAGWVLLAQHAGVNAFLGMLFGLSLRPGAQPLVTRMATAFHGTITADMDRYTRQVTVAWTIFFAAMTGVSVGLFASGQIWLWSMLANFLTLPLVLLMFAGEFLIRQRRLPGIRHASVLQSIEAFNQVRAKDAAREPRT
ncbi:MAG: acyl carrier protein [Burkholderiaceae bacterium]